MTTTKELHYRYMLGISVAVIVAILAFFYFDVKDFVDKLSFALTLSSLLLAVLAIFYTIISGQTQQQQLTKLNETNNSLGNAANEITNAANEIRSFVVEAPVHFKELGTKLDGFMINYSVPRPSHESQEDTIAAKSSAALNITLEQFAWMLGRCPIAAMPLLYLFQKALAKGKKIEFEVFSEIVELQFQYAGAFLAGIAATGLISFHVDKDALIPTHCAQVVNDNIAELLNVLQQGLKAHNARHLKDRIASIDKHFV